MEGVFSKIQVVGVLPPVFDFFPDTHYSLGEDTEKDNDTHRGEEADRENFANRENQSSDNQDSPEANLYAELHFSFHK